MKLLEILLAIAAIFIAIYNFDIYNFNRCIVSILLLITAFLNLSPYENINKYVRYFGAFLTVFLIMKILVSG